MTNARGRGSYVRLRLGDVDRLPVSVSVAPYVSVLALLTDAVGGLNRGAPDAWRDAVNAVVHPRSVAAIRPIVHPGRSVSPDCIVPLTPRVDVPAETAIEFLRSADSETLLSDLAEEFGDRIPVHWRGAAERPDRWLDAFAAAGADAWGALAELWRQARPLLDREIERVGVAYIRGGVEGLLATLDPRIRYHVGSLYLPDPEPDEFDLGSRRLVLVPMLSGPRSQITNFDEPDVAWIAYPVPGLGQLWSGHAPDKRADADPLAQVLGASRARVLRCLAKPASLGELAKSLNCAPNTATYHCGQLVTAGLVVRQRRGQSIRLSLSDRGAALVEVLSGR